MHWINPGFQRQVFKHAKILSERSKKMKEQEKNKSSVLVAESAYISQKAQFGLVMIGIFHSTNIASQINWFENKKSR